MPTSRWENMRITRIDIEGRQGRYATMTRPQGSQWIEITILTPYQPNGKEHRIAANADESELWNRARNLQHAIAAMVSFLSTAVSTVGTNSPEVDSQIAWFTQELTDLVGGSEALNSLCEQIGL